MEGQEDAEAQAGTHAEEQNLAPVARDRTDRALRDGDGCLAGAVEAQAVNTEAHAAAERELKGEGVEEVLEIAEHSTILCAGVSGRVVHCPSYLFSHTPTRLRRTQQ
jgi:hypothetical protein